MGYIRSAAKEDASRIAEIIIFNYRLNFYPIFRDDEYYFGELQVLSAAEKYRSDDNALHGVYVYDDGVVKGVISIDGNEIKKLFVEPSFQCSGVGAKLLDFAVERQNVTFLHVLEKNERAVRFYQKHGFHLTDERIPEEGTSEYLIRMER